MTWTSVLMVVAAAAAAASGAAAAASGAAAAAAAAAGADEPHFPLSIVHLNDFHARFEETDLSSGSCPKEGGGSDCVGGYARVVTMVKKLLAQRPEALLLNAGDNFQGTLWFTLFKANVTAHFLNMLDWHAVTLGNHEFDKGVDEAVEFIRLLRAPMIVANLNTTKEPRMDGLCKSSIIRTVDGRRVGIIGVITASTEYTSSPGDLGFLDEEAAVAAEARRLHEEGVQIIVLLSHAGIDVDKVIATNDPYVDVIVGGHSHTLLYSPPEAAPGGGSAYDTYPLIPPRSDGRKVAIVQAYAYTKYLGNLTAWFDADGELVSAEGNPIFLSAQVEMDAAVVAALEPWEEQMREERDRVIGHSAVLLEQANGVCRAGECNLGSLVADAQVLAHVGLGGQGAWTRAAIGITNAGGLRTPVRAGNITYGDLMTTLPFENTVDYMEVQGKDLAAALEQAVMDTRLQWPRDQAWGRAYFGMLQVSGLHVVYDPSRLSGSRLVELSMLCHACDVPIFEPVQDDKWYPIAINSFLADGGDAFNIFKEKRRNWQKGPFDYDVMQNFLRTRNPITQARDGRITFTESGDDGVEGRGSSLPCLSLATMTLSVGALLLMERGA